MLRPEVHHRFTDAGPSRGADDAKASCLHENTDKNDIGSFQGLAPHRILKDTCCTYEAFGLMGASTCDSADSLIYASRDIGVERIKRIKERVVRGMQLADCLIQSDLRNAANALVDRLPGGGSFFLPLP